VTPEELARRCDWIAARASRRLREANDLRAEFYFGKGAALYRLCTPFVDVALNHGDRKEILFALTRCLVETRGYDCFIMATDSWSFEGNERYLALTNKERAALVDRGFKRLMALGYGKRTEAISVSGQTPDFYHLAVVRYERDPPRIASTESTAVDAIKGRSTMWGDWDHPRMRETYEAVKASPITIPGTEAMPMVNIETEDP